MVTLGWCNICECRIESRMMWRIDQEYLRFDTNVDGVVVVRKKIAFAKKGDGVHANLERVSFM
jgi:hypothetical protein